MYRKTLRVRSDSLWSPWCLRLYEFMLRRSGGRRGRALAFLLLQRRQFFQLLLLRRVQVLQPLAEQRELPLVLLLLPLEHWHFMTFQAKAASTKWRGCRDEASLALAVPLTHCISHTPCKWGHTGIFLLILKAGPFCDMSTNKPRCEAALYLHLLPINLSQLPSPSTSSQSVSFQLCLSCCCAFHQCAAWRPSVGFPNPDFMHVEIWISIIGGGEIWLPWQ